MRKVLIVVGFLLLSLGAQAQFEQGKWLINPSVTGLGFSWNKETKAKFGFGVQTGAFVTNSVMLLIEGAAEWTSPVDKYTLGVGGRYYFDQTGVYVGTGLNASRYDYDGARDNITNWGLRLEAGYAFFLSRTVTIEPAVYYNHSFKDSDYSDIGFKIGFGFYF